MMVVTCGVGGGGWAGGGVGGGKEGSERVQGAKGYLVWKGLKK